MAEAAEGGGVEDGVEAERLGGCVGVVREVAYRGRDADLHGSRHGDGGDAVVVARLLLEDSVLENLGQLLRTAEDAVPICAPSVPVLEVHGLKHRFAVRLVVPVGSATVECWQANLGS